MAALETPQYPRGDESVLLVEPDAETRVLAAFMLGRLGYRTADARNAEEAVRLFDEHDGAFDLLVAEAAMPRVSGRDLAGNLRGRRPNLRALFLADARYVRLARPAASREGLRFLVRPFTIASLANSVRMALDVDNTGRRKTFAAGLRP